MNTLNELLNQHTFLDNIVIHNIPFELQRIDDVEPLLDSITESQFNEDERIPYWAELWPSAIGLAEYILQHTNDFAGRNVIELGCGLGLSGIVAYKAGARVLFTDNDAHALQFTANNFYRNFKQEAQVLLLDWRQPDIDTKFDVVVAADVLYEKRWLEPVYHTMDKLVSQQGDIYLAEPGRTIAKDFFRLLDKSGWQYTQEPMSIEFNANKHNINIYHIIKC
jgi:predicted nicotinamide N-methyase